VPFAKHQSDEFELLRAMRNPRIKPLSVLRPDLPEPLLEAVARALEPEPELRTIQASEFAAVVSAHIDVRAGWLELGTLLESWKSTLERSVKRAPGSESTDRSGSRVESTLRYEEMALAFDEEPPPDSPTFEAHALPSDPRALAALPLADADDSLELASPPASAADLARSRETDPPAPPAAEQRAAPRLHAPPAGKKRALGPLLALAVLVTACLVAALLASGVR
jgi:hypothetical protein